MIDNRPYSLGSYARARFIRHFLLVLASAGCATRTPGETARGTVVMRSATGVSHGTLTLDATPAGVRIAGNLTGLPPGAHGIHFHEAGRCDPPDFTSAGSHLNPASALHGLQNPLGPHAGDLPNVTVSSNGQVMVDLTSARVTLETDSPRGVFGGDGTALVIHAYPDDQRTDPSGESGDRIACGVVQRR